MCQQSYNTFEARSSTNKIKTTWKRWKFKISCDADASHGNLTDEGSHLGYLVFLVGENKKYSILNWQVKIFKCVLIGVFWLQRH